MKSQNENSATDQKKKQKNKRYAFAQREGDDFSCVRLLEGQYDGVIYKYDKVAFEPKPLDSGDIPLRFTYDIMVNPKKVDVESTDFKNYIGDILIEIVEEQLKQGKVEFNG
jgi:hypothetical protein